LAPRRVSTLLFAAWSVAVACSGAPHKDATEAPPSAGEGGAPYSLDSALKVFRVGIDSTTELESGEASVDAIVGRLVRTVKQQDTASLRAIVMTRREFAWLYYPTSRYTRAPTKQEPGLVWFLHVENSAKGATRLMNRHGGSLRLLSNECKAPPRVEGDNRIWDDCVQRVMEGTDTVVTRLFGGLIERHGRFKIFSYSNDL
jgi:hypothetical protein